MSARKLFAYTLKGAVSACHDLLAMCGDAPEHGSMRDAQHQHRWYRRACMPLNGPVAEMGIDMEHARACSGTCTRLPYLNIITKAPLAIMMAGTSHIKAHLE